MPVVTTVITITSTTPPDYFRTTPEEYQGPTPTSGEPFLAATNQAPFPGVTYIPPSPLETQEPISGAPKDGNIFTLLGNIGPYHPSPGFGADEYPLPHGSNISWLNTLHRHGSRYPTDPIALGSVIPASGATFSGDLAWLNSWHYDLGTNILSDGGRGELYDSGVLHVYEYGHLFDPNQTKKLVARTTTEDRMRKSAQNFFAGFFGLGYDDFVEIEFIIDETGFNNSLAGYNACNNSNNYRTSSGANVSAAWEKQYTVAAIDRFNADTKGFTWNVTWIYEAQQLCAYETVNLGYSRWCALFTYEEWEHFEYSIDLDFAGTYGFQSPTARANGVGYVEEVLSRINHHRITKATGSDNVTLDDMPSTFPLHQVLNFDFTHEVNLFSVMTAFGLKQFAPLLPTGHYKVDRQLIVSHMVPFGCRLDIEMIEAPHPVSADRPSGESQYESGGPTTYIHFILNQRTLPLGKSYPSCGQRADGWCELDTWLDIQANALKEADYDYSCNGDYAPPAFGAIDNGAPPPPKS